MKENLDGKPPGQKSDMGFSTGCLFALSSLARRFEGIRNVWAGDWGVCPIRNSLYGGRHSILVDIQRR